VVVTGGGGGFGRCTAHELANLGASVALVGRQINKLEAVAEEILGIYPERKEHITLHSCDIRDEAAVKATVGRIVVAHGRIDGLYNCAGGQYPAKLRDISLKGWDSVVRTNLHGTFLFSRECYVQWMERNGGSIVNILADIWGGLPGMGHSGAARGGVMTFTETAACEWGYAGVRVNAVAPGYVASAGLDHYDEVYRQLLRSLKTKVPLQRFATEAEISAAVVFLLSEAAAFITGAVLRVDGGVPTARHTWKLQAAERSFPYNGFPQYRSPEIFSSKSGVSEES
jgi:citronellol/citronellal dehydrogenase